MFITVSTKAQQWTPCWERWTTVHVHMISRQILIFAFSVRPKSPKRSLAFRFSTKFSSSQLIPACNISFLSHRSWNDYRKTFWWRWQMMKALGYCYCARPSWLCLVLKRARVRSRIFLTSNRHQMTTLWEQRQRKAVQSLMSLLHSRYLKLPEKAALW
jgi:hypothetical protein